MQLSAAEMGKLLAGSPRLRWLDIDNFDLLPFQKALLSLEDVFIGRMHLHSLQLLSPSELPRLKRLQVSAWQAPEVQPSVDDVCALLLSLPRLTEISLPCWQPDQLASAVRKRLPERARWVKLFGC